MLRATLIVALSTLFFACQKAETKPADSPQRVPASESDGVVSFCASTPECAAGHRCSTDDGACEKPPGCKPGDLCAAICYGVCTSTTTTLPPPGRCTSDEDCRMFSDYCTGCD